LAKIKRKKKKKKKASSTTAAEAPVRQKKTSEPSSGNGAAKPKRRSSAKAMAEKQRDISVSEFFSKNRHLLGFDNPRKALLTTIKEAVDNSGSMSNKRAATGTKSASKTTAPASSKSKSR